MKVTTLDKLRQFLSCFSVRHRLFFFGGMSLMLLALVIIIQLFFSNSIEKALREQQKALELNSSVSKRYEITSTTISNWDKNAISYYEKSQKSGKDALDWLLKHSSVKKETKQSISSLNATIDSLFTVVYANSEKEFNTQLLSNEYITRADKAAESIKQKLENREADLQIEGLRLSVQESEFLNVIRDGKILSLTTITLLNKLQQDKDTTLEKQFSFFIKNNVSILDAFVSFAETMNDTFFESNASTFVSNFKAVLPLADSLFYLKKTVAGFVGKFKNAGDQMVLIAESLLARAETQVSSAKSASAIALAFNVVISLLLLSSFSITIISSINIPIQNLIGYVESLGKGDLSILITEEGTDEVSQITRSLKKTIGNLRNMVVTLGNNASSLNTHSEQTKSVVQHVSTLSADQHLKTSHLNNSASGVVSIVKEMADTTSILSVSVNTIAASIEQMSASIGEVTTTCLEESRVALEADKSAQSVQAKMDTLGSSAEQIGQVISVIKRIAQKTNLLALNASIEAATAGTAGAGFTVVAHEVKALAQQTTAATEDIRVHIQSMQATTRNAINSINEIVEIIHKISTYSDTIVHAVQEQKTTVNEIARTMSNAGSSAEKIAENTRDSSKNMEEISDAIHDVDSLSSQSRHAIEEINSVTFQLSTISSELNTMIHQFKL